MGFGIVILVLGAIAAVVLLQGHEPRLWRLALFLPFWLGALGVFQAVGST